jgi:hypothetical protein
VVLDFFEQAMASVILLHAALDSFANECLPAGFELQVKGENLSRDQLEARGIELRLSKAASEALGKPNLMTSDPSTWAAVVELKGLRDDCSHVRSRNAYSTEADADTIFSRLLAADIQRLESTVEAVMSHYGDAPRQVTTESSGD